MTNGFFRWWITLQVGSPLALSRPFSVGDAVPLPQDKIAYIQKLQLCNTLQQQLEKDSMFARGHNLTRILTDMHVAHTYAYELRT